MPRAHPIRDAGLALTLLTAIPVRVEMPAEQPTQAGAWFPAVGVLFGVVGYGIVKVSQLARVEQHSQLVIGALVVIAWALLSRLLHFDGLADVADGYWGSHDVARRLEIMSDSRTGAFGASAVTLTVILEVSAIATLLYRPHELPILLIPILARFSATCAAWLGSPARPGGLGRSVMARPTALALAIGLLPVAGALAGLWVGFHVRGLAIGALGVALALTVPHVISRRFGGVTGDVMGASVLITETLLFAAFTMVV